MSESQTTASGLEILLDLLTDAGHIPGGCDNCNAHQTVALTTDPQLRHAWLVTVHHEPACPSHPAAADTEHGYDEVHCPGCGQLTFRDWLTEHTDCHKEATR